MSLAIMDKKPATATVQMFHDNVVAVVVFRLFIRLRTQSTIDGQG